MCWQVGTCHHTSPPAVKGKGVGDRLLGRRRLALLPVLRCKPASYFDQRRRPMLTTRKRDKLTLLIEKRLLSPSHPSTPVRPGSWSNFNACSQIVRHVPLDLHFTPLLVAFK